MRKLAKIAMTRRVAGQGHNATGSSNISTGMEVGSDDAAVLSSPGEAEAAAADWSSELDRYLWPHLPEVLVHNVLRFLPAESVFKFRSVCKKWHQTLTDSTFLSTRQGAPHRNPLCVIADVPNKRFAVYNIASDNWYYPPYEDFFAGPVPSHRTMLTAAAAGLVLLEVLPEPNSEDQNRVVDGNVRRMAGTGNIESLLLVNPVNKSYRHLPDFQERNSEDANDVRCPKVMGIDQDPQTGSYQILARSTRFHMGRVDRARPGRAQFHVYDLDANSWEMIYDSSEGSGPEERDKTYRVLGPAVLHGGFWYYLTSAHRFWGPGNRDATSHVFRVRRGLAEAVRAPLPDETGLIVEFLQLSVCQGKLILAGSVKTKDTKILNEWMSFRFWLLDEEKEEWVDYLKMPRYLVNYLGDRSAKRFALDLECSVDGDYICFWVGRPAEAQSSKTIEMIIYNIVEDSWWTVSSEVEIPRTRFDNRGGFGWSHARGLYNKPFGYFLFNPSLNITL